jgi:hypothetical protein
MIKKCTSVTKKMLISFSFYLFIIRLQKDMEIVNAYRILKHTSLLSIDKWHYSILNTVIV